MKSDQTIIRKTLMEQFNFITNLLGIKDPNIIILDVLDAGTHKEVIAKLDYPAPKCPYCQGQMAVVETSLVKKNHQIATIVKQKIAQKLIEKVPMTAIAESLDVSTSTVIRKLKEFKFKTDLNCLPEYMSWDVETVREVTVSIGR